MQKNYLLLALLVLTMLACSPSKTQQASEGITDGMYLLTGTYTTQGSEGIYVYKLDTITGQTELVSTTKVANPSYLAISDNENFVYAVTESNDIEVDAAHAYAFDKTEGKLIHISTQSTRGAAPCYIATDKAGTMIVTANYAGGSIMAFEVDKNGGLKPSDTLIKFEGKGVNKERQQQAHLHCVQFTPDGRYLLANDLGNDKIYKFDLDDSRKLLKLGSPADTKVKAGSGPRHIVFHPHNKYAYLITELSGDVVAFHYNDGNLEEFQTIKADTLNAMGSGDIHISPDGKFLYASNRLKGDGLAIFSIHQDNGTLTKVGYQNTGIHPRNFVITPNGRLLLVACRDSNLVQIFRRDATTGLLDDTGKTIELSMPVCLKLASFK